MKDISGNYVHPSAVVSPKAELGRGVTVGPFTLIHGNVVVGAGTSIAAHCEIGCPSPVPGAQPLLIGTGCTIRSHSVFYEGSTFGDDMVTGHHVTVREGTKAGQALQIGTFSDIQGDCTIGDFVRFHSSVHVGKHSMVGDFVWIFPYVVLTNDPHPPSEIQKGVILEDYVAVASMAVVHPGVRIGSGALVGAQSNVLSDVASDTIVVGSPAREIGPTRRIRLQDGSGQPSYPWRRHFHRGYPAEVVKRWRSEFDVGHAEPTP